MALPVGIQLFSVRDAIEKDLEGTLRALKEMGYEGVETCGGCCGDSPEAMKALCDEIGLQIISGHVGTGEIIDETEDTIKKFKAMGAEYVAICAFWGDYQYKQKDYDEMIKRLDKAGAYFKENGLQVLYHNHDWEFKKENDEYHLDLTFKDVSDDNVLPELDVCWVTIGHGNAAEYMTKYSGRCPLVHLKDFYCDGEYNYEKCNYEHPESFEFRPVGYGRVDMTAVLKASEEIGAKWVIVEQDTPTLGLTSLENAKISRDWLKTLGW